MNRPPNTRLYRSPRQRAAFCFMFVFFLFISVSSAVYAPGVSGKVIWAIAGIAICSVALRGALTVVIGTERGIRVRNLFGSFSLPWQSIEQFDVGRWGLLRAVCLIQTRDGQTFHAFAIQENNLGENQSKLPAKKLVQQLNDELIEHADTTSPKPEGMEGESQGAVT